MARAFVLQMTAPNAHSGSPEPRPELSYRARRILYAVVSEYIASGEPVGSRRLSKRYGINLSPATIRNELADLDDAGCLTQPHSSAGRVPTQLGFRVFIDALVQMRAVNGDDKQSILARMRGLRPGVDDVVREAGRLLASMAGAAAVVTRPRTDVEPIAQLRFMAVLEKHLLAVIVTRSGAIQNRLIELSEPIDAVELERVNNLLTGEMGERTLVEVRSGLAERMANERDDYDLLRRRAAAIVDLAVAADPVADVTIEGTGLLFDRKEFDSAEKIRAYLRTFEEKERLLDLLDRTLIAGGVQVVVGSEAMLAGAPDVGIITANYHAGGVRAGAVGVIGPIRMDYAKLMPLVGFTAQAISDVLDGEVRAEEGDADE